MNEQTQQVYNRTRRIMALEALTNRLDGLARQVRENWSEVAVNFDEGELEQLQNLLSKYTLSARKHRDELLDALESDYPG